MLRPADKQDARFLRDMLRHAYHWRMSEDAERPVYRYVRNWGRPGDAGVVAMDGPHAYGAAWYRLFTADEPGFGFVDERTPELTIAVVPSRRGRGAGRELLEALLDRARAGGLDAVSLSTDPEQVGWYEQFGFERVADSPHAVTMIKRFSLR